MNKKAFDDIIVVVLILGLVLALLVIVYEFGGFHSNETFSITRQECHNETRDVQYSFPNDFNIIQCPNFLLNTQCYDSKGNTILNLACQKNGISCYSFINLNDTILVKNSNSNPYYSTFTMYSNSAWVPNYFSVDKPYDLPTKGKETQQVCEDKEVDSIQMFKDITNTNPECSSAIISVKDCPTGEPNSDTCIRGKCFELSEINRTDITRDWLDKNAGCQDACMKVSTGEVSCPKCINWKLGDYKIEVVK